MFEDLSPASMIRALDGLSSPVLGFSVRRWLAKIMDMHAPVTALQPVRVRGGEKPRRKPTCAGGFRRLVGGLARGVGGGGGRVPM